MRHSGVHQLLVRALVVVCTVFVFSSCGSSTDPIMNASLDTSNRGLVTFIFKHPQAKPGENFFVARTSDPKLIAIAREQLSRGPAKQTLHVNGRLTRGNGGFNSPWSWHIQDNRWELAEITAEVCDGKPMDVEGDINYWVDRVKRYCPWNAVIIREE